MVRKRIACMATIQPFYHSAISPFPPSTAVVCGTKRFAQIFLAICCVILTLLWLPGLRYPILSDSAVYALLGKSIWEHGTYTLYNAPFAKQLPLLAVLSYPFTQTLGYHLGMKFLALLAGWGVLVATYFLTRRTFSPLIAAFTVLALLFHPGFVLMTMLGSADLLFAFLFLLSILLYLRAEDDERWYLAMGVCMGLACLTRYNGVPLFALFPGYAAWKRRDHLRHPWLWAGLALGAGLFSLWLLRNALTFGSPFHTEYTGELAQTSPHHLAQFFSNVLYYLSPIHNIFFLFPFALWGIWRFGRGRPLLLWAMAAAWVLTSIWWVQAIRFAFPGYPILLAFAVAGVFDLARSAKSLASVFLIACLLGFGTVHAASFCLYTYGGCNAWFDRTVGILPKDMHLTPEGFYMWSLARDYIDTHAGSGATFVTNDPLEGVVWRTGVFRPDIRVKEKDDGACPSYRIGNEAHPGEEVLFSTPPPLNMVMRKGCGK